MLRSKALPSDSPSPPLECLAPCWLLVWLLLKKIFETGSWCQSEAKTCATVVKSLSTVFSCFLRHSCGKTLPPFRHVMGYMVKDGGWSKLNFMNRVIKNLDKLHVIEPERKYSNSESQRGSEKPTLCGSKLQPSRKLGLVCQHAQVKLWGKLPFGGHSGRKRQFDDLNGFVLKL